MFVNVVDWPEQDDVHKLNAASFDELSLQLEYIKGDIAAFEIQPVASRSIRTCRAPSRPSFALSSGDAYCSLGFKYYYSLVDDVDVTSFNEQLYRSAQDRLSSYGMIGSFVEQPGSDDLADMRSPFMPLTCSVGSRPVNTANLDDIFELRQARQEAGLDLVHETTLVCNGTAVTTYF